MSSNRLPIQARSRQLSRRSPSQVPLSRKIVKGALISCAITVVLSMVLDLLFSTIALLSDDPLSRIPALGIVSLMISMFFGGFICVKQVGEAPLICGITEGAACVIIATILSLILTGIPSSGYIFFQHFALRIASVLFSILGAFAGNVKRKSKKRRFG